MEPQGENGKKANAGLAQWVPGISLLRNYRLEWLKSDLLAGLSVCVVMIPSVVAYAGIMGLPPENGLYAALVPLLVYPWFGTSRQMIVGPDIAISLLTASAIGTLAAGDSSRAGTLAAAVALVSGLLLLAGARAKIGAVADFLSKPVLVGYMTGAALILMGSQLGKLFGVPLKTSDFFPRLAELAGKIQQTHPPTLAFGLILLIVLGLLRRFARKLPAALVVCVLATLASIALGLEDQGISVIGKFPSGLPSFKVPEVNWRDIHTMLPAAIGIALLTYTEGILLARAFAAKNGYDVNANRELAALGLADLLTAFFQGFSITGSQARTTINDSAGGRTQLASLVAAAALIIFLLFLTPVMARLPEVALASILIYGGFTLVEFDVMVRIYRYYPSSGFLAALTTLGVLAMGVVPGILIGVAFSLLGLINRVSHPPDAVLREVPGHGFHDIGASNEGSTVPGLIAWRFYGPLIFSNAGHFVERVRELVRSNAEHGQPIQCFLLDAQAISDIDVTAAEALQSIHRELQQQGIALKIAHANRPLRAILERTGLTREINETSFFSSVHECVQQFQSGKLRLATPQIPQIPSRKP
jgi:SulP family sulfate permease